MTWESFYGQDEDFVIGIYGRDSWNEIGPSSHMKPYMKKLIGKAAEREKGVLYWTKNQEQLNQCDMVVVNELFSSFEEWNKLKIDRPTVFYLQNSKPKPNRIMKKADEMFDVVWTPANHLPYDSPAFWTPFSTFLVDDKGLAEKDAIIQQRRHHNDDWRTQGMKDFLGSSDKSFDFATTDTDAQLEKVGLLNHPKLNRIATRNFEAYQNWKYMIEFASKWWLKQNEYWSDRQPIAVSHDQIVATNYSETLDNWDSAVSIDDYIKGEYSVGDKEIRSDMKKWSMDTLLDRVWDETKAELDL